MDVAADLRAMLAGPVGSPVIFAGGVTVRANASVASIDDSLGGEGIIAGRTRILTFASADVPTLKAGDLLTWNNTQWKVTRIVLASQGWVTRAFLGAP